MSAHPQPDENLLRRRARYFFSTDRRSRREVHSFAAAMSSMGECAVVGGMLRDLCLGGNRAFRSDVDFVAAVDDLSAFDRRMKALGASVNRFGGYGVRLDAWQVDVWPLQRTWAAREGHAKVDQLRDILGTTFFDWDAILYFPATGQVSARNGYFEGLRDRVLDVNLLPNPNPLGNAVRALRYVCMWHARLAPTLAMHVERQVAEHGWERFLQVECASFGTHHLRWLNPDEVARKLRIGAQGEIVSLAGNDAAPRGSGPKARQRGRKASEPTIDENGTSGRLRDRARKTCSATKAML